MYYMLHITCYMLLITHQILSILYSLFFNLYFPSYAIHYTYYTLHTCTHTHSPFLVFSMRFSNSSVSSISHLLKEHFSVVFQTFQCLQYISVPSISHHSLASCPCSRLSRIPFGATLGNRSVLRRS